MTGEKPFRFGVNMTAPGSRAEWVEKCRKAEDFGYDVLSAADHLGMAPPFPALVLAGEVTSRVKLNTFVLNAPFYNPVLLARDVAGTDQFTDGRLELGLGAGYVKAEFEAAGMPFPSPRERVDHLERTILELKKQATPPLLIGGRGDRILTLAAEHADTIAFTGTAKTPDGAALVPASAEDIEERVEFVRSKLDGRDAEFNLLCHFVHITDDRAGVLDELAKRTQGVLTAGQLAEVPTALVGSPAEVADQLHAHRERFGLSYYTVLESNLEQFAPVLEHLR